jgi:tetratricopeptide (TPR) repeat protein
MPSQTAMVLALQASELHYAGDPARCRALAEEAIEIARGAGDPAALAQTLNDASMAIWVPETLQERKQLADELVELAERLDDPRLSFRAALASGAAALEAGDRSRVESSLAKMRALAASVPEPTMTWLRLLRESGWALISGDLQAAEQRAIEGFEVGTASGQPDALMQFGAPLANVRYQQGRLGELVEQVVQIAGEPDSPVVWRPVAAVALLESGRETEARELALAVVLQDVPLDRLWSCCIFYLAEVCFRLRLVDRAGELYELLAPFSRQFGTIVHGLSGSIGWALGTLATTLERYEQAEVHFATAAEIEEAFGAPLLLARTHAGWARALIANGRPENLDRAKHMLEQAEETAGRLGGGLVTREVAECRAALATISG